MRAKVKNKISSNFIDMNIKEKPPEKIKKVIKETSEEKNTKNCEAKRDI